MSYNLKYTGRQIDAHIDRIVSGEIAPYYLSFQVEDLFRLVHNVGAEPVQVNVQRIIDAINNDRPMRAYVMLDYAEYRGYCTAVGYIDDFVYLKIFDGRYIYELEIPLDATEITGDNIFFYDLSGMSPSTGGAKPYITDFTSLQLLSIAGTEDVIVTPMQGIINALAANRPVLVPYDNGLAGYSVLEGFAEDLFYFTITEGGGVQIIVEASWDRDEIHGADVRYVSPPTPLSDGGIQYFADAFFSRTGKKYALPASATGVEDYVLATLEDVEQAKAASGAYPRVETESTAVTLKANTYTEIVPPIVDSVQIYLSDDYSSLLTNEYVVKFQVDINSSGAELIVPSDVRWAGGAVPPMTPGKSYEISFLGYNAIFVEF